MPTPSTEKNIESVLNRITRRHARRHPSIPFTRASRRVGPARISFATESISAESAPAPADEICRILETDNVMGVGISEKVSDGKATGLTAMTFYVERKKAKSKLAPSERVPAEIPSSITGDQTIVTDVKAIGRLRPEINATRKRFQPGNSIGHIDATVGTLGAIVSRDGELFILSNSHVLALSGTAKRGDAIVYPGVYDGGAMTDDLVAKLARFKKFIPGPAYKNRVDCALAKPTPERLVDLMAEIKGLGLPGRTIKPVRGMKVIKVGRTTGKTTGKIQDVHFTFTLDYKGSVGEIGFIDQVLCSRYTDEGDSGSLVVEKVTGRAVGLHFAGAEGGSVFSPIDEVLKTLGCKLVTRTLKLKSNGTKKTPVRESRE